MMPAPSVLAERFAALEQVLAARRRRSQALVALASGRVTVEQVLESEDPAIGLTIRCAESGRPPPPSCWITRS
jgi:hypothetical protein